MMEKILVSLGSLLVASTVAFVLYSLIVQLSTHLK